MQVLFSPNGGCAAQLIHLIAVAAETINVAIYEFDLPYIAAALIAAHARGVKVQVVMNPDSARVNQKVTAELIAAGINPKLDHRVKLMHSKYAVIDSITVATGSYNWTVDAEKNNAENLLWFTDQPTAAAYEMNFLKLWNESA